MTNVPAMISDTSITVFLDGKPHTLNNTFPQFLELTEALKKPVHDLKELRELVSIPEYIKGKSFGDVLVADSGDAVHYKGRPVHSALVDRLLQMLSQGFDITPWANFLNRLMRNPNKSSAEQLYFFLEACQLPITPDGYFLAYKKVRSNYTDCHSGKFDNSVGAVPMMKREDCDDRRDVTCSSGLHFCSQAYLGNFGGDRTMVVKVDPADVVAVPDDYNNAKGRACRYEVVGELGGSVTVDSVESTAVNEDYPEDDSNVVGVDSSDLFGGEFTAQQVVDTFEYEETLTAAAKRVGVARSTFTRWLREAREVLKAQETLYGGLWTADEVLNAVKTSNSQKQAAEYLNVPRSTLGGWLKKING